MFQRIWNRRPGLAKSLILASLAVGCAPAPVPGKIGLVEGFAGIVAADEPRAAVVGRDVLGNGGTAVDAAVAMYFTMTVTMPSRVGLGGGGVCVVFDGQKKTGEAIEFLPRSAPSGGMVPSGMRAMAALHARNGTQAWGMLMAPAETMARFGHAVSRAFAQDLALAAGKIEADPDLRRIFAARNGRLATTGDKIVQPELSTVLSGIRRQGASYLYSGTFAARLAEASTDAGLPLTAEDIRKNVPRLIPAVEVPAGKRFVAYFSPPRASAGLVAGQLWGALTESGDYASASDEDREHVFAEASSRVFSQRAGWLRPDGTTTEPPEALMSGERLERIMAGYTPGQHTPTATLSPAPEEISSEAYSAGFVVADQYLKAVACNFTMNRLFGAGRFAAGTGIILAAPPRSKNDGSTTLPAVVVGNTATGDVRFVGIGGGGAVGTTALVRTMLDTLTRDQALDAAIGRSRLHTAGAPDVLMHENTLSEAVRASLSQRGHRLRVAARLGHVNAIFCPRGIKDRPRECQAASDPRGHGLAQVAQ